MTAQNGSNEPLVLPRITSPVTLDGLSQEPAWQSIDPLPVSMLYPTYRGDMTEETEIRVAYDEDYLYASIRAYYENPEDIRANTYVRDRWGEDDEFTLILDTFYDRENAMMFMVNPTGNRIDFQLFNDAETSQGSFMNRDWNTFWEAEAVITDDGWFAELRIPFSSLQFNVNDEGDVIMGLKVYRWIPSKYENHQYPPAPPSLRNPYLKPSTARKVLLTGIQNEQPLYISPYSLGGLQQEFALNSRQTDYLFNSDLNGDIGGDIRYSVTDDLSLDLTVNTDFAQVEADNEQVNLSRFPLFFPEKRQFFQERSGIFEFNTGGRTTLFFSRRIGLDGQGNPVPIIGGGRLTGRAGQWDIGLLNMQTADSRNLPSENFGVFRFRRAAFNDQSFFGGIYTHRLGADGSVNIGYGADAGLQITPHDYLVVRWAQTYDSRQGWGLSSGRLRTRIERSRLQGLGYYVDGIWSGEHYTPDLGFITARNFTQVTSEISHGWLFDQQSRLRSTRALIWNSTRLRNSDKITEIISTSTVLLYEFKSGNGGVIWQNITTEDLPEALRFSDDALVPAGRYSFYTLGLDFNTTPGYLLRGSVNLELGSFYDGSKITLNAGPTWNTSPHLELGVNYTLNRVRLPERKQEFNSHVIRLRSLFSLNKHFSAQSFLQFNNTRELVLANVRLRYNFSEGNDLWLVYNDRLNTNRGSFEPELPVSNGRTILLKYTHTFQL
ncbi:MAG: DUF5916 domain-containing protein [Balneolaceae bacterium]|nr:DUF5916 domain-containing protein [Balneolaceae bacterium]